MAKDLRVNFSQVRSTAQALFTNPERPARIFLCSHLGRPKGEANPAYSLKPVAEYLKGLVSNPVYFADDCIGESAKKARKSPASR